MNISCNAFFVTEYSEITYFCNSNFANSDMIKNQVVKLKWNWLRL